LPLNKSFIAATFQRNQIAVLLAIYGYTVRLNQTIQYQDLYSAVSSPPQGFAELAMNHIVRFKRVNSLHLNLKRIYNDANSCPSKQIYEKMQKYNAE